MMVSAYYSYLMFTGSVYTNDVITFVISSGVQLDKCKVCKMQKLEQGFQIKF